MIGETASPESVRTPQSCLDPMVNAWGGIGRPIYSKRTRRGLNRVNLLRSHLSRYASDTFGSVGTGFVTFRLPPPLNSVSLGICMDLNVQRPSEWTSIDGPYEIASYCLAENSNLLILLNAWLESPGDTGADHAWTTMDFWAQRLRPLWEQREEISTNDKHEMNVVVCNRTGYENGESSVSSLCGRTGK